MGIWQWIVETLRSYPELAIFLALAVGFFIGPKKLAGFSLGNVTATLLAAVAIGQLGIAVPGPIKSTFFLLFLFAVGYGVGPQFFRGLGKEGPKQILFSVIVLALCLLVPIVCAKLAGLDLGYAVGLYAGSQTISASIGVASDQINSPRTPGRSGQGLPRRDSDRLRRDVHLRHHRVRDRAGADRPEADRRRPCGRVRRVREADGRRPGRAGPWRLLRLPPGRGACLPRSTRRAVSPASRCVSCFRACASSSSASAAATDSSMRMPTACSSPATSWRSPGRATRWWRKSSRSFRRSTTRACSTCRSRWWTSSCAARR